MSEVYGESYPSWVNRERWGEYWLWGGMGEGGGEGWMGGCERMGEDGRECRNR